jgi:hypothetical protein
VKHVVVDGSNIATEGRSLPSLAQLDEAVQAFLADYPADKLTVVVDATFGHRIDASEHDAYEEAILAGELVCPPAGAIGRGDAFVLQIADKADAVVFSNDSFQEFHGDYQWLFDEGRLIGGKPVPEVGWVFVARAPVRGPTSRRATKATRSARSSRPARSQSSPRASLPMPTPKSPPPRQTKATASVEQPVPAASNGDSNGDGDANSDSNGNGNGNGGRRSSRRRGGARVEPVNEPMPFIEFVSAHPVGSTVDGVVERFSSHGAYVTLGEVHGYVPLKLLGDPPPRSAKEILTVGENRSFVVASFDPPRRSVDVRPLDLVPTVDGEAVELAVEPPAEPVEAPAKKRTPAKKATKKAVAEAGSPGEEPPARKKQAVAKKAAAKKSPAKKAAATAKKSATEKPAAAVKKAAGTAKAPAAKKATATKKTVATKKSAATKSSTARKTVATKAAATPTAKKAAAKKASSTKRAAAEKSPAKKLAVGKSASKKTPAKKAAPKR